MKICQFCFNEFVPNVSYQIYCDKECREMATKQKTAEKYQQKRLKRLRSNPQVCKGGCGAVLSIYNDSGRCNNCIINQKQFDKTIREIMSQFDSKL